MTWEIPDWTKKKEKANKAKILKQRFLEKSYSRAKKVEELIKKLPKKNEQQILITLQSFNAYAIFLYLNSKIKIKELYFTTFSIDQNTAEEIIKYAVENKKVKVTLVLTSLLKHDRIERQKMLVKASKENKNFTFIEAYNHTKLILIKTESENYVIEGSGNLSANARIEQYRFENCENTYNFHKEWIENIEELSATKDVKIHRYGI